MLALGGVMPSSSAFQHPPSPPFHLGYFGGYSYKSAVTATTAFMMQVDASSSYVVRNEFTHLLHLQRRPLKVLSKSQKSGIGCAYKRSWDFESCFSQGVCKAPRIRKCSLNTIICRAEDTDWQREEARWLREEKRWLREEERWLREEARWAAERKELLERARVSEDQVTALKLEIVQLRRQGKDETVSNLIVNLTSLLQSLNMAASPGTEHQGSSFQAQISSSTSTHTDIDKALGDISVGTPTKSVVTVESVSQPSILEFVVVPTVPSQSDGRKRRVLKRGAEGDEVKAMQEALAKLGFHSGDEDMEYSTFSSGTERAVRSWQASLGTLDDGILTIELLKKLLGEETPEEKPEEKPSSSLSQSTTMPPAKAAASNAGAKNASSEWKTGGTVKAAAPSFTDAKDAIADKKAKASAGAATEKQTGIKTDSFSPKLPSSNGVGASQKRVYLLGENRWEEPDRLLSKNGPTVTAAVTKMLGERCFACKGQGNMMCTECEGTGALNVEEQFLEWADEDAKCPYCEGKGAVDCDVCDGKGVKAFA